MEETSEIAPLPFGLSVGPETPRPMSGEPIQMVDAVRHRFHPRIANTHTVGPRLVIEDRRPTRGNSVHSEAWLDLPAQCSRTSGKTLEWLIVRQAGGVTQHTFTGSADDLDDLYSMLRRLEVHQTFTCRPVPFDFDEADA